MPLQRLHVLFVAEMARKGAGEADKPVRARPTTCVCVSAAMYASACVCESVCVDGRMCLRGRAGAQVTSLESVIHGLEEALESRDAAVARLSAQLEPLRVEVAILMADRCGTDRGAACMRACMHSHGVRHACTRARASWHETPFQRRLSLSRACLCCPRHACLHACMDGGPTCAPQGPHRCG